MGTNELRPEWYPVGWDCESYASEWDVCTLASLGFGRGPALSGVEVSLSGFARGGALILQVNSANDRGGCAVVLRLNRYEVARNPAVLHTRIQGAAEALGLPRPPLPPVMRPVAWRRPPVELRTVPAGGSASAPAWVPSGWIYEAELLDGLIVRRAYMPPRMADELRMGTPKFSVWASELEGTADDVTFEPGRVAVHLVREDGSDLVAWAGRVDRPAGVGDVIVVSARLAAFAASLSPEVR